MSKQLIKILAICALVILCPLVIVGVSLMATEAVGCTLTILDGGIEKLGDQDFGGKESNVTIYVDGKEQTSDKVTVSKNSEIKVVYSGEGYDFQGWYEGKYEEISREGNTITEKELSKEKTYKFSIKKDTVLTAVRDVKTYNITYAGKYDDGSDVDLAAATLVYNQPLATLEAKAGGVQAGWYVLGDAGNVFTKANFEKSGDYNVYPSWSGQMLIEYIKGSTVISSERVFENQVASYVLPNANSDIVKNNLTAGYEFDKWTNQNGGAEVTTITFNSSGIQLLLNEKLITYTLNVKYNALSSETAQITYDVVNKFSNYSATRQYYTFKGLEYNSTEYLFNSTTNSYGNLGDIIVQSGSKTVDVTAVWKCNFKNLMFNIYGLANYEYNGTTKDWALLDENGEFVETEEQAVTFEDNAGSFYFDASDNVYDLFISGYNGIQTMTNNPVSGFAGRIGIVVEDTGNAYSLDLTTSEMTFGYILEMLSSDLMHGTLDNVTNISIEVHFNVA